MFYNYYDVDVYKNVDFQMIHNYLSIHILFIFLKYHIAYV